MKGYLNLIVCRFNEQLMNIIRQSSLAVFIFGLSYFSLSASAESYVGIQAGASIGNKVNSVIVDVNPNYQGSLITNFLPPSAVKPVQDARFTGAKQSDAKLENSFSIGAKAGHYFDAIPFLGVEGEFNFTKPDLKEQNITTSNLNNTTLLTSNGTVTKKQLAADIYDFTSAFSLMARYPAFKRVTPYIGVGPNFHYFRVRGTGAAEINTDVVLETLGAPKTPNVLVQGPGVKQDKFSIGLQAKAGIRFNITKHLSADVEYKYNYSPVRMDPFRDLNNYRGGYNSHQVAGALVYRFGNIKW
jgi:opacity protein-like surface antigen